MPPRRVDEPTRAHADLGDVAQTCGRSTLDAERVDDVLPVRPCLHQASRRERDGRHVGSEPRDPIRGLVVVQRGAASRRVPRATTRVRPSAAGHIRGAPSPSAVRAAPDPPRARRDGRGTGPGRSSAHAAQVSVAARCAIWSRTVQPSAGVGTSHSASRSGATIASRSRSSAIEIREQRVVLEPLHQTMRLV